MKPEPEDSPGVAKPMRSNKQTKYAIDTKKAFSISSSFLLFSISSNVPARCLHLIYLYHKLSYNVKQNFHFPLLSVMRSSGGGSDQRVTFGFGFGLANDFACSETAKKIAGPISAPQHLKESGNKRETPLKLVGKSCKHQVFRVRLALVGSGEKGSIRIRAHITRKLVIV